MVIKAINMTTAEILASLENASLEDRIAMIEVILQSVKDEIAKDSQSRVTAHKFELITFDLGEDVTVTREDLYSERTV
jgi:hypothetical protein